MSDEDKTIDSTMEKNEEKETLNQDTQTVEGSEDNATNDVKQEENLYEKELAELRKREADLQAELDKKDEIIEHKNRAIESTKKKLQISDISEKEELVKRLESLESRLGGSEVKGVISKFTADPAEKELIEYHYNKSIVRTGDMDKDIQMAIAIANQNLVMQQKRNQAIEEGNENFLASFSKNGSIKGEMPSQTANPVQRAAEDLVRSINPNAVKYVKEQFN